MQNLPKIAGYRTSVNWLILISLVLLVLAITFLISSAPKVGLVVPLGLIGLSIAVFSIIFPLFGLYTCIFISFFVFDLLRFLNAELPLASSIDILTYITFLGVLINKILRKEPLWDNRRSPILFMFLLIFIYFIVEFFNPNGGSVNLFFNTFRRFASLLIFMYCAIQLFKDQKAITQFLKIFLGLALVAGIYGVYEKWFGMPAYELAWIMADEQRIAMSSLDNGEFRMASFLVNSTDFGLLMSGVSIIFLVLYFQLPTTRFYKRLLLASTLICILGMTYSGTRTATAMLIVEFGLYILMTIKESRTAFFGAFFAFVLATIILMPSYGNGTINRLKSTFEVKTDESLKVRDINRKLIQPYIYTHPIGGGIGTSGVVNLEYNPDHPLAGFPSDSGLLTIVLEYGYIGLILQCLTYFIILQQGVRGHYRSKDPKVKAIFLAATISLFGYTFAQYSQVAIGQIPSGFLYYGLVAIIIRLLEFEQKKNELLQLNKFK